MAIRTRSHKPDEWAAKINHTHIINDPFVKNFISQCSFPEELTEIEEWDALRFKILDQNTNNPIKHIIAVDGGYTTVEVRKNFPSSQFAFFQFGSVLLDLEDLESLSKKPFIFQRICRSCIILNGASLQYRSRISLRRQSFRSKIPSEGPSMIFS